MNTKLRLIASLINFFVIAVADTLSPDLQMYWENNMVHPYFDNTTKRDVTAIAGQTCQLHCRVKSLGDRAVSWIRKRDLHILTVGILTYTNDQRFQSLHTEGSDEWTLRITSPQARDSGVYECQVSTEPKISQAFRLNVVVSKAKILGNAELFVKSGSDINLTCVALQSPQPPSFIYWYKGGRVINYSQRGGISVLTEQQTRTSRLVIARASPSDSGNYTCSPSNSDSASVVVHVIKGEHPAAMQHGVNHAERVHKSDQIIAVLVISLFCIQLLVSGFPNSINMYHKQQNHLRIEASRTRKGQNTKHPTSNIPNDSHRHPQPQHHLIFHAVTPSEQAAHEYRRKKPSDLGGGFQCSYKAIALPHSPQQTKLPNHEGNDQARNGHNSGHCRRQELSATKDKLCRPMELCFSRFQK